MDAFATQRAELIGLIRENSAPLEPMATEWEPRSVRFAPEIRAVVLDVYGTMFVSSAGENGIDRNESRAVEAMAAALELAGGDPRRARSGLSHYQEMIRQAQEKRRSLGIGHPEADVREIWPEVLSRLGGDPGMAERAAVLFECRVNPVWPMPGLAECLESLRASGRVLGIVSNAQFYTPLLFPALAGAELDALGFDPDAVIFSFAQLESKPSRALFRHLAEKLSISHRIGPGEILYVGNDRLKDIFPAQAEGLRTAFFAGDRRSCRWRSEDSFLGDLEPDVVITRLEQLPAMLD